jgi:hypothetical protein
VALALLLGLVSSAWAQTRSGNIYGTVTDESGAVLAGAAVSLTGPTIGGRSTTAGSDGKFRFLVVDPGTYTLTLSLTRFASVRREVLVNTGVEVTLLFNMKVATVEETVNVTAETPVVDTRKIGTYTTLTKEELNQVPNSRDPWAVLRTVPGIILDRVNIAGNESGQQASFQGKGTTGASWNMDGIEITDMAAIGASPTYYDYDAFEEINVTTGGSGGIGINFVTKRGTNKFHGSARGFFTHDDLQWSNIPAELKADPRLQGSDKADHIQQIADYGAELGGPIVKDKLWFWGTYGKQDIRLIRTNQTSDKTNLVGFNAKLNWQAGTNDLISFFWFRGQKVKNGRGVGFGVNEPDSFLWNQADNRPPNRPPGLFKLEWNHIFSSNFFLNGKGSYFGTGFALHPRGGDISGGVDFFGGNAYGSYFDFTIERPQTTVNVDGNYFASGMGGNHEFKFGFGYKRNPVKTFSTLGGNGLFVFQSGPSSGYALVYRNNIVAYKSEYKDVYLEDAFTKDRLTLNLGVRFKQQSGGSEAATIPAHETFPELLPAIDFPGSGQAIEWNNFTPRVALTYALDESRKTVVRTSYARYAGQLAGSYTNFASPLSSPSYLAYNWVDLNGDHLAQKNEVLISQGIQYYGYVDPANPSSIESPNIIDPDIKAPNSSEFIVGIDRELLPNFSVGAAYTYRRTSDVIWSPRIGLTRADYTPNAPASKNGFTAQTFSPNPAKIAAFAGGSILTNRPDYYQQFSGFEIAATKRLSNKWMMRTAFSYNDWTEHFVGGVENSKGVQNPTRTTGNPLVDGGQVVPVSGGSGKGQIYFNAKWQLAANALYQLPAGFEVAGALFGRQGLARPIHLRIGAGQDGRLRALATPEVDTNRYPNIWNLDLRLSKNLKIAGDASLAISVDLFNVLNNDVESYRQFDAQSSAFGRLDEVLSPRIVRFGVRLTF